jgi:transcriptional regulator with XRE-family HTH domain
MIGGILMSDSLGNKIKKLRKDQKMTQSELAGSEMTKSMLSQIENDIAMPSMKNLQYLAARLGKPPAYFLSNETDQSDVQAEELQEELRKSASMIMDGKFREALANLLTIPKNYNLDHESKLYADFLVRLGECYIELNENEKGKEKITEAVTIYKNKFLYIEAAKSYSELIGVSWNNFNYENSLMILEEAFHIYQNSISKDSAFEIELLYYKSVILISLNRLEEGLSVTKDALQISKRTNIYYRSDELYKNLAVINSFQENYEHFDEYMEKARQYSVFTENYRVLSTLDGYLGYLENKKGNPTKAAQYLKKALEMAPRHLAPIYYTELGKSYYFMKQYQEALDILSSVDYPEYTPSKLDYLLIWSSKIYKGLCLNHLGKTSEALEEALLGLNKIVTAGSSKTLAHAYRSLSELYSDQSDYENAFVYLKKAGEVEEEAVKNKLYY